jgi:UDP-N-acetyl-D-glucosamine dehydrogenase
MKGTALLRRRIQSRRANLSIFGQGYVGLTLACIAADEGFSVIGVDVDEDRIRDLSQGVLNVSGVESGLFDSGFSTGRLAFTTDPSVVEASDLIFVCVPTPVVVNGPDLSYIEEACRQVARFLHPGQLVVLESTSYPGTTQGPVRRILEETGLVAGRDFLLAYSPERIDPGNRAFNFRNVPRIVGGLTAESTGVAALFYAQLVDKVVDVSSCRTAELAKLLENTFRHVNIALVNEMAMICHETEIDTWEVIDAAASKPFGFLPFYPGPGVGGHCIPLDPTYLAWQVRRDAGHQFRILEQAQDINAQMPAWVASRIGESLNDRGKPVRGARILVLGVAYKPDIGDVRESPALKVITQLVRRGAKVSFHDPYVSEISVNGDLHERTQLSQRAVSIADCVAIMTPHRSYDLQWIAQHASLIFDARNAYGQHRPANVVRM